MLQPVYEFNGSSFVLARYREAGSFTYHAGHGHFHFDGYNYYRLRQNNGGTPGAYVNRPDGTAIIGEKVGFCLINVGSSFIMENGQSSTTLPGYNAAGQPGTGCGRRRSDWVSMNSGLSSGMRLSKGAAMQLVSPSPVRLLLPPKRTSTRRSEN